MSPDGGVQPVTWDRSMFMNSHREAFQILFAKDRAASIRSGFQSDIRSRRG